MFVRTAFCILLLACSGSSSSNPKMDANGSGKMDSGKQIDAPLDDFGCGGNTACPVDQACCAMPGSPTTFKCVATASCPAQDQVNCDGPDECGGASPICCGVYVANGGTYPQCSISALGTSCTNAGQCPTHLGQTCSDTTKVRICHIASDCSEPQNNKCCTFMSSGAQITFCTDATTAALAGATCH